MFCCSDAATCKEKNCLKKLLGCFTVLTNTIDVFNVQQNGLGHGHNIISFIT
jgi:hypothetical protein